MSDEELEAIRKRKLYAMQQRGSDEQQKEARAEQQYQAQKEALLKQILTSEARQRLTNLKLIKPEFTEQLELQLIQLAQSGRISIPLSDARLKQILIQLQSKKRDTKIRRI